MARSEFPLTVGSMRATAGWVNGVFCEKPIGSSANSYG